VPSDLQADLTADLLTEAQRPSAPAEDPSVSSPAPAPSPGPALTVRLTPLQWSRPAVDVAGRGVGVAVQAGPWRLEVSF
jgi:hypothetical protein